ncbi:putative trichothecene 3-O-acetyltransferase [Stemphylium lycopersici]|uniref:Trichothecene 3-O-acetyltransferase n=1 Tax=Stemphylium lycopersici TaxID=183478 RepID=A0A364N392_STELY|nr:putative trichothecene 3-O-acetyltransferase [Stemphylium lycopersici]RAR10767.1 trichothecene 3-O-acetyltransferase [Stemphylium lycopersici]
MAKNDDSNNLDIFGQQPFFTMNTLIYFAFALPPPPPTSSSSTTSTTATKTAILTTLTNGLERLYKHFPWLSHGVINAGASESSTGTYKLVPVCERPGIVVRDLSGDGETTPTMSNLQLANFPMSSIDEKMFAPRPTFPGPPSSANGQKEGTADPIPTPPFLIQATFIQNGLILTFLSQHNCMDMTGQAHVIHLLHKACTGEPFSDEEIAAGNKERGGIVALLDDSWVPGKDVLGRHVTTRPTATSASDAGAGAGAAATPAQPPQPGTWAYFNFPSSALSRLKVAAEEGLQAGLYVSTDDAVTAVIWQAIVRARMPRLDSNSNSNTDYSPSDSTTQQQQQQQQTSTPRSHSAPCTVPRTWAM